MRNVLSVAVLVAAQAASAQTRCETVIVSSTNRAEDPAGEVRAPVDDREPLLRLPKIGETRAQLDLKFKTYDDSELSFDLFLPPADAGSATQPAVVLIVNGTGEVDGSSFHKRKECEGWARLIAASGMAAVTYSVRPDGPAEILQDAWAIIRHLRDHESDLCVDADRMAILGIGDQSLFAFDVMRDAAFTGRVKCGVLVCPTKLLFMYSSNSPREYRADVPVKIVASGSQARSEGALLPLGLPGQPTPPISYTYVNERQRFDLFDASETAKGAMLDTLQFMKDHTDPDPAVPAQAVE